MPLTEIPHTVLLREVIRTVEEIGAPMTVRALQNARGLNPSTLEPDTRYVLEAVAEELKTSVEKILNNHYAKTELRIYSVALSSYLLHKYFNLSALQCGKIFGLGRGTVSRRKNIIDELNRHTKGEAGKYFEAKERLTILIKKYKKQKK